MINETNLAQLKENIGTIYFGGGTPSLLTISEIKKLLASVYEKYDVAGNAEITLEANPDDITEERLLEWKSAGINRLSIGIQSFKDKDLRWMNRAHNAEQSLSCIQQVKNAGYDNFSVDLIYGTPTLSDSDWLKNLETVIDLDVPHLSCYSLTVEDKTPLQKMIALKKAEDVDPGKQAAQFLLLMDRLDDAGYEHYEISNFARPGYRSRHNSSYWSGEFYIGIGPSAHSFDGTTRCWNLNNNALYIASLQKNIIPFEEERLTKIQQLNEYIMTALRTAEGIDLYHVKEKFGENKGDKLQAAAGRHISNHNIKSAGHRLVLTKEGKLFADGIAASLFFEEKAPAVI